jgi:hypothetical protein
MYQSDNDRKAHASRDAAREDLIAQYELEAAQGSEEGLAFLNLMGQEVPDPTIIDPPLGYIQQPDLMELMRRMIRSEFSNAIDQTQFETFEEADDFDIDDDPVDYSSPYEQYFDPSPGQPPGPPGEIHPLRQDPNAETPPAKPQEPAQDSTSASPLPSS